MLTPRKLGSTRLPRDVAKSYQMRYRCHSDHQQRDPLPQPETSHAAIEVRSARRIDDHEKRRLYPAARVEDLEP